MIVDYPCRMSKLGSVSLNLMLSLFLLLIIAMRASFVAATLRFTERVVDLKKCSLRVACIHSFLFSI